MNPIAFLFMIIAAAGLTPLLYTAISSQGQQEQATVAAMQMARIDKAAQGYITANAAAVEAGSTATSPAIITVPMLVNTGYLPNGFNANNPYGQIWEVQVLQPAANQLQALVVSQGGQTVDAKQAGMVAQAAGSTGGVIGGGTGKFAVPGCNAGVACGVYAGWDVSTNGYQNVAPGHLAALIEYSNGQLQSDYLYRTAVPGQPQLNTMQTNLNMGNNNINNAQDVNVNNDVTLGNPGAAAGGSPATNPGQLGVDEPAGQGFPSGWGGGIHTWDEYANGTISTGENGYQATSITGFGDVGSINVQDANNGNYVGINSADTGSNPEIYTNGIIDAGNGFGGNYFSTFNGAWWANSSGDSSQTGEAQAGYINSTGDVNAQYALTVGPASGYGGNWWANNSGNSSQAGNAFVGGQVTAGYDATLGTAGGTANIGWGCSPNGEIAANANGSGQILACQGGAWQEPQSAPAYTQEATYLLPNINGGENVGYWRLCTMSGKSNNGGGYAAVNTNGGQNAFGQWDWIISESGSGDEWFTCFN